MDKQQSKPAYVIKRTQLWGVFILLFVSRILAMVMIPLNDSTEARYGEMARKMLATHNWVTLWHDVGVPFWGKPPLSIWLAALSMKLFGINAFAARLPSLLLSMGILAMVYHVIRRYRGEGIATVGMLMLASSGLFYLASGTVMMDPALLFGVILSQLAFWEALQRRLVLGPTCGYLFFIGLAIGLLAKGPLILILVGGSVGGWVIYQRNWRICWQAIPWITGTLLMLAIVLPWYVLAELRTPGFLNYFILGEHFGRFFQSAWQGDKYGFAHASHLGMIWPYALLGLLPWSVWMWAMLQRNSRLWITLLLKQDETGWYTYWLACCLFPCVFFTFSNNLIYPYVLPSLPAFAILFAEFWVGVRFKTKHLLRSACIVGGCFIIGAALFYIAPRLVSNSQNQMVALWQQQPDWQDNPLVYLKNHVDFSAQFYSQGRAIATPDLQHLCTRVDPSRAVYVVVDQLEDAFPLVDTKVVGTVRRGVHQALYLVKVGRCP
ncbi:MAG: glycosyltransferase family 39 protein [Gammaproteobacteria bacterium]|nr:glycosyltransferase family 39 protein [Gammaproteobacteria bacterium]